MDFEITEMTVFLVFLSNNRDPMFSRHDGILEKFSSIRSLFIRRRTMDSSFDIESVIREQSDFVVIQLDVGVFY